MKLKKLTALLLAALMVLALAACGAKDEDKNTDTGDGPKNAEEAAARYSALMEQENAILSENTDLWEKVFLSADKGMTMRRTARTTVISCSTPSRAPRISSPTKSLHC